MNTNKQKRWKISISSTLLVCAALLWIYSFYQYHLITQPSSINTSSSLIASSSLNNNTTRLKADGVIINHTIVNGKSLDVVKDDDESWHDEIQRSLKAHPLHRIDGGNHTYDIVDILVLLAQSPECLRKPIFVSMAHIGAATYWQLIENFVYTMLKFGLSDCALMICVDDKECMRLCHTAHFPCYHFHITSSSPSYFALSSSSPSVMEQIAHLKLYYLPLALLRDINVMVILDLDVGFILNPMLLLQDFMTDNHSNSSLISSSSLLSSLSYDILVQQDLTFTMDRTIEKWKAWYISYMPNIGIMAIKGNNNSHVIRLFDLAWKDYITMKKKLRNQPGKDQNKVVKAMEKLTRQSSLKWGYFNENMTLLLDKFYKFHDTRIELGGELSESILNSRGGSRYSTDSVRSKSGGGYHYGTVAAHTTCFEQSSKVMGLKSVNAFWNPYYYNKYRRTLSKKLIFIDKTQLFQEIQTLFYLAALTNRSLILPNVLGNYMAFTPTHRHENFKPYQGSHYNRSASKQYTSENQWLWPGFRLVSVYDRKNPHNKATRHLKLSSSSSATPSLLLNVEVLEPAFYWRIARDYSVYSSGASSSNNSTTSASSSSLSGKVPDPYIVDYPVPRHSISSSRASAAMSVERLVSVLLSPTVHSQSRVVLDITYELTTSSSIHRSIKYNKHDLSSKHQKQAQVEEEEKIKLRRRESLQRWIHDSVGYFDAYSTELKHYSALPSLILGSVITDTTSSVVSSSSSSLNTIDAHQKQQQNLADSHFRWLLHKEILKFVQPCELIFDQGKGNRSCFDKC